MLSTFTEHAANRHDKSDQDDEGRRIVVDEGQPESKPDGLRDAMDVIEDPMHQSPLPSAASVEARDLLAHAVAWYRAEGDARDSSGMHDGAMSDAIAITPIKIGQAFDFHGARGSVVVPDARDLNPQDQFTLMAWIRPRSWQRADGNSAPSAAVAKLSPSGSDGFELQATPDGLLAQFNTPGIALTLNEVRAMPLRLALGEWTHLAATYNGRDFVLYRNGAPVAGAPIGPKTVAATGGELVIRGQGFDGMIDDAALFNRALSRVEVKKIYDGTLSDKDWLAPVAIVPTSRDGPCYWSYATDTPGEGWAQVEFDDSSWKLAPGGFGVSRWQPRTLWNTSDIWMRHEFELPDNPAAEPLLTCPRLALRHDDDAEVYINGVLAASLPYAGETACPLGAEAIAALRAGKNVLAVHCKNTFPPQQYVDVGLLDYPWLKVFVPTSQEATSNWRYSTVQPPGAWKTLAFDDSPWSVGAAGFGAATQPRSMIRTPWTTREIWLRRAFDLSESITGESLIECARLVINHDDDVEVYLNGVLAVSLGGAENEDLSFDHHTAWPISDDALAALRPGQNVLAVHCRNNGSEQYIDVGLIGARRRKRLEWPPVLAAMPTSPRAPQTKGVPAELPAGDNGRETRFAGGSGGLPKRLVQPGALLRGVEFKLGKWNGATCIEDLAPLFTFIRPRLLPGGVVADDGFAVGAINVDTQYGVNAFQLVYMRVRADGRLDPNEWEVSEWIGNHSQKTYQALSGFGVPIIGLHLRKGIILDAIALVAEREPTAREVLQAAVSDVKAGRSLEIDLREFPQIADADLAALAGAERLEALNLDGAHIGDEGLAHVAKLPNLKSLTLSRTAVTDAGVAQLARLERLQSLWLEDLAVSDASLDTLAGLPVLSVLSLVRDRITDAGAARLREMEALRTLNLDGTSIGNAGLRQLCTPNMALRWLSLSHTKITDAGLPALASLKHLESLNFDLDEISDACFDVLARLPGLRELSVWHDHVTDAGMARLGQITSLRHLVLNETEITDAGLDHLGRLKQLEWVSIWNTQVTDKGMARLRAALPKVSIRR
ncbi:MAG: LamG-like jellyroll fold domain-containing protein [Pirellulales bacterium]